MTLPSKLAGRTMVMVSTQDWDDLHTRKQRFAERFAAGGCRVLYVEAQWHWLTYLRRRDRATARLAHAGKPPRLLKENLWLWTPPPQLPFFQMWEPLARWNNRRLAPQLTSALAAIGAGDPPLVYLYTPYNSLLLDTLKHGATVYECVDDYAAAKGLIRAHTVEQLEADTLGHVDACVVTAQALYDQRRSKIANLHLIPNAADVKHFSRAREGKVDPRVAAIPAPRLGFLGMVHYWIDIDLLTHVARTRPDWHIVLVGPTAIDTSSMRMLPNVHLLGRQPFEQLPEIVAGFDVCLNPYVLDDVAIGCSPLKLYEYLATGKPVVSVPMPEALRFAPPVYIGHGYDGFVEACAHALEETPPQRAAREAAQIELARAHSWDERFASTLAVWENILS
jgi:glycosyltransferase involved in cell wall biosynthesis